MDEIPTYLEQIEDIEAILLNEEERKKLMTDRNRATLTKVRLNTSISSVTWKSKELRRAVIKDISLK